MRSKIKTKPKFSAKKKQKDPVDRIGVQIDKNWKEYVNENWSDIREQLKDISADDEASYMIIAIDKDSRDVSVDFIGDSQYWTGISRSGFWTAGMLVDKNTTKADLLALDVSDDSGFYDDLDFLGKQT